jgi:hypothetical protein
MITVDGPERAKGALWQALQKVVHLPGALQVPVESTMGREDPLVPGGFSGDDTATGSSRGAQRAV